MVTSKKRQPPTTARSQNVHEALQADSRRSPLGLGGDDAPDAHLAAAVALSNPLQRPALSLRGLRPHLVAQHSYHLGTAAAVIPHLMDMGHADALSSQDHQLHTHTLARNMISLAMADEVTHELTRRGLRCAPVKGYAFLLDLYAQDVGRRRMFDLDLLIDADTFIDAFPVMKALGWRRQLDAPITARLNVESVWTRRSGPVRVTLELHRRLCLPGRFAIDHRALWKRTTPSSTADGPPWRVDPIDALLYLAMHKAQHGYCNDSRDLVDATNLALRHTIDWATLVTRAHHWACAGATWVFLHRARRAFGLPAPDAAIAALRPSHPRQRALLALLPDATLTPRFMQHRNNRRPLPGKILTSLTTTDAPALEAIALSAVAARSLADRVTLALNLPEAALDALDTLPLPSLTSS